MSLGSYRAFTYTLPLESLGEAFHFESSMFRIIGIVRIRIVRTTDGGIIRTLN